MSLGVPAESVGTIAGAQRITELQTELQKVSNFRRYDREATSA